jgi:type III secretion protein N (ATPase)
MMQHLQNVKQVKLLECIKYQLASIDLVQSYGYVRKIQGTLIEGVVPGVSIGELCEIFNPSHPEVVILCEVIGFSHESTLLSPLGVLDGVSDSFLIRPLRKQHSLKVGPHLLGRIVDGFGSTLDNLGLFSFKPGESMMRQVLAPAPLPFERPRIFEPFFTGIRAVDTLLTIGQGQRVGIFASPGCGKTSLLAAIGRGANIDVIVLGLIGERGREVREFTEHEFGPELIKKTVIVCATSDRTSIERVRAAFTATTIAEGFRDLGYRVLLMIDSLTRLARAQREIGLAAGESPARAGFPPSVYALLPRLIERAGLTERGRITAFYTVLLEGDLKSDPISEEAVSLLDGHILLSRKLAESGHFPAIDILPSISRVMGNIVDANHYKASMHIRQILSQYRDMELLIRLGEYKPGLNPEMDSVIRSYPKIIHLLQQNTQISSDYQTSIDMLMSATKL